MVEPYRLAAGDVRAATHINNVPRSKSCMATPVAKEGIDLLLPGDQNPFAL